VKKSVQPLNGAVDNTDKSVSHPLCQHALSRARQGGSVPETLSDETRYRLLKYLEANPDASQRALARELGVSLGKVNYCMRALLDRGWVKMLNVKNSDNKLAYKYLLTPKGIEQKARITVRFLRKRLAEYEALEEEISMLRKEVGVLTRSTED
jgi:MarR family transcriptional regulator, temperature-dependent positive regulator of motility